MDFIPRIQSNLSKGTSELVTVLKIHQGSKSRAPCHDLALGHFLPSFCSSKPVHLSVPQTFYVLFAHAVPSAWNAVPCTHSQLALSHVSGHSLKFPSSERSSLVTPTPGGPSCVVSAEHLAFCHEVDSLIHVSSLSTLGGQGWRGPLFCSAPTKGPGTLWAFIPYVLE